MSWKEFLKPDWKKIILALIIFFLPIPFPEAVACPFPCIFNPVENVTSCTKCPPYEIRIVSLGWHSIEMFLALRNFMFLINVLLTVVFSYILSCVIFWIYNRVRKK